jgi:Flp pilus assembly protein TadG
LDVLTSGRRRDERGAVMVLLALVLATLLGFSAFAVDLGYDREVVAHLQSGTDAGALAGGRELPKGAADATKATKARNVAATYAARGLFDGPTPALGTPTCSGNTCTYTIRTVTLTVTSPYTPSSGLSAGVGAQNLIYVQACQPGGSFFRKALSNTASTLCRSSVGRHINAPSSYQFGLVTLDPHQCGSLQFAGNSDTVLSATGGVAVNSDCADSNVGALDSSGSSWKLQSNFIGVVGHATLAPCSPPSNCVQTTPTEGITPFSDPLGLSAPTQPLLSLPCPSGNALIQLVLPGYYGDSHGCTFNGNITYIFLGGGLYYFAHAFNTNGGASLLCSSVQLTLPPVSLASLVSCGQPTWNQDGSVNNAGGPTFYVPPGGGTISMNGSGSLNLPGNANYAGVSIWQGDTTGGTINGTASFQLGTIYAANSTMNFGGTAGNILDVTGMVIAKNVSIGGSFTFDIHVPGSAPAINVGEDNGLEY